MPVLDAHTHMFPPEIIEARERIAIRDRGFSMIYSRLNARMVDKEGIRSYLDDENVDMAVVTGFPFEDGGLISAANDYLLEMAALDPRIIPFIAVDRRNEGTAMREVERCIESGARGVGELAYNDTGFSDDERRGLRGLGEYLQEKGLPLMLHLNEQVGHDYAGKTHIDFGSVLRFAEDHPALDMILAHMGGGICFHEFMPEIKRTLSRVYYDLAAVPFLYSREIYAYSASFLASKVLFGSDYPLLSFARYKPHIEELPESARRKILYENGSELLGI